MATSPEEDERELGPERSGSPVADAAWPVGGGEMGELIRQRDWSTTPLGPTPGWPQSLRTAVDICLASNTPIGIYWGSDLIFLYNDAWMELAGDRHPTALGRPACEVFPEIWTDIEPRFSRVLSTGEAAGPKEQPARQNSVDSKDNVYLSHQLSAIRSEDGTVAGVFSIVDDVTDRRRAEEKLRRDRRRFREMIDSLPAAVYTTDAQGRLTHFNSAAIEFSGAEPELATDQWCVSWKLYYPDGRPMPHKERPMVVALNEDRSIRGAEAIAECPDGSRIWFEAYPSPLHDDDGNIVGGINMLVDVTERKRVQADREQLLREVEAERKHLADIFRNAPSFMCVLQGPDHVFERVNDLYRQLVGGRELVGKPAREALPEIEGQGFFELLDHVYTSGETYTASDTRVLLRSESGKPLEPAYVNFTYQPIRGADGSTTGIFVQGVDLTERKQAEAALARVTAESERQKRLYEAIISSTPDLVYVFDLDYRFTFVNDALLEMWGRTLEESLGKTLVEVGYEPWHADMHKAEIDQVVATRQPVRGEVPFEHATLGERIYDYIFVPVLNEEGDVEAVAGTTRDITERRRTEDALKELNETLEDRVRQRTETVRQLASKLTMAEQEERRRISRILHDDLQQLLYGIQLKMTFVRRGAQKYSEEGLRAHVEQATERLDQAIETTRQLTVDLSPPVLDGEGLTDTLGWLQTQMRELHGLDVTLKSAEPFRIPDEDMRVLLFQIVRELLFNVVKHADTDRATVELYEQNGSLAIRVVDSGSGFSVASAEAEQASNGGFGLFSVRKRLDLFGGHMNIDSQPGEGTRITISTNVSLQ